MVIDRNIPEDEPIVSKKVTQTTYDNIPKGQYFIIGDAERCEWLKPPYKAKLYLKPGSLSSIFLIKNSKDLERFNQSYGIQSIFDEVEITTINWKKVSKDYGGLEIRNYDYVMNIIKKDPDYVNKYLWFLYYIGCNWGCIWDLDLIKKIE